MNWAFAPGVAALVVAVLGFIHNFRTLKQAAPRAESEKQGVDITNLRAIIAELRQARADDRTEFIRQIGIIRDDSTAARMEATKAHSEAETAHREAASAQRALHETRFWWITEHLPWDQHVVALLMQLNPEAAANLPQRKDPPMWDEEI